MTIFPFSALLDSYQNSARNRGGVLVYDPDARLTARQAAAVAGVSRQLVNWWRSEGHLVPVGRRGRSHLYRAGDVLKAEAATRNHPNSRRLVPVPEL